MSFLRGVAGFCKNAVVARLPSMLGFLVAHRRDVVGGLVAVTAIALIVANGLFMQSGPHPAPIFAVKPLPVVANEPTGTVIPRPRPAALAEAPKREPIVTPVATPMPVPVPVPVPMPMPRPRIQAATAAAAAHGDPIAELISQQPHPLSAVQRALNEYGYGPIKATGAYDDATRAAITRFEKDHNLPPTGQVTPRFRRELATATGRPLD
jgi:Putative peptidoglycan binding domain